MSPSAAACAPSVGLSSCNVHAHAQHVGAVARVAGVHQRLVGGGERVGHHRDAHAVGERLVHQRHAARAGHEVRRRRSPPPMRARRACGSSRVVRAAASVVAPRRRPCPASRRARRAGARCSSSRPASSCADAGRGRQRRAGDRRRRAPRAARSAARRRRRVAPASALHRIRLLAVPVRVEDAPTARHDRPARQHVHVDEVRGRAAHEVFVGDVAPAGDGQRAVGDEQLVVHAAVDALELVQRQQHARAPARRRAPAAG